MFEEGRKERWFRREREKKEGAVSTGKEREREGRSELE